MFILFLLQDSAREARPAAVPVPDVLGQVQPSSLLRLGTRLGGVQLPAQARRQGELQIKG